MLVLTITSIWVLMGIIQVPIIRDLKYRFWAIKPKPKLSDYFRPFVFLGPFLLITYVFYTTFKECKQ